MDVQFTIYHLCELLRGFGVVYVDHASCNMEAVATARAFLY